MFNKRLLSICDSSKKWIGLTVLMNWISIVCNIALILFIGTTVDKLLSGNLNLNIYYSHAFNKICGKLHVYKILTLFIR